MTVRVRVPSPLRRYTDSNAEVSVDAATVGDALTELDRRHPGIGARLYDESGNLRQFINVFVNDTDIRSREGLETQVADGDELSIIPAVAGGWTRI